MATTGLRRERFYGWTALAGAILVYFCGCGNLWFSYGVFLPSISETFGWGRAALSGPYSLFILVMGLLAPLVGASITRFGARKNIIFGNLLAVLGLVGMSLIKDIWQVYLFYSVLIGVGNAFGMFLPATTIANNWFAKRRSLAMSLVVASGAIGGFALPPFITWLISGLGWRLTWVCLAVIHLVLSVGVAGALIKNKPEDIGQVPDGKVAQEAQEVEAGRTALSRVYQTPVDWKTREALRTRALWMIMVFTAATMFLLQIIMAHQVIYLQHLGFSPMIAATTLGIFAGLSIVGRLGIGALGSRFEGRHLAAACLGGFAIGVIILMNVKALPGTCLYLYALLSGVSYGGLIVLKPVMLGAYYGRAHYAQILGWCTLLVTLFGAAGPLLAGVIYDTTGSYMPAFVIAVALVGVGLVCALLAQPPKPRITLPR